jgi:hypothetical protein
VILAGLAIWLVLLIVAAVLLGGGLLLLFLAPLLAGQLATSTSRPRLERRASGPDRMRALIEAQRTERRRRSSLRVTLTRGGVALLGAAAVALVAAGVLAFTGGGT